MKQQTITCIQRKKDKGEKIVALTAYDYPSARMADQSGVDIVLVGDSLGMVVQGETHTLSVTLPQMIYHCTMVSRAVRSALVVGDMPYGSFHTTPARAASAAIRLIKRGGAAAVKMEGGQKRLPIIQAILDAEIPVMGHIGLTPQSFHAMGGYRVQGKGMAAVDGLLRDAQAIAEAGCFALVLEGIPAPVARLITKQVPIPTIGIGAGNGCDGQILVFHDMLGLNPSCSYTFVRRYAELAMLAEAAIRRYGDDVRNGSFPTADESFSLDQTVLSELEKRYGNCL